MEQVVEAILGLGGTLAYVVIGLLAFGEAAAFVGLMLPGELAVLLGGVLASQGRVSLPVVLATVAVAAVAGDSAGYEIGRRWGPRLLHWRIVRRHADAIRQAERYLRHRGGLMVFVGRWASVLRVIVPGVAGMSRMPYGRFFAFNVIGGVAWAAALTLAGYVAGESYARVDAATGWGSWLLGGAVLTWVGLRWAVRRRRARSSEVVPAAPDDEVTAPACNDEVTAFTRDEVLI